MTGDNILAKVRMGSYQGIRHQMCLPVHCQRTRSNNKTQTTLGPKRAQLFNIPTLTLAQRKAITATGKPASGPAINGLIKPLAAKS